MADALELVLELSRAKRVEDPYAMSMRPQEYNLRSAGGEYQRAELDWDESLIAAIESLRSPRRDREILQRLGNQLRAFLAPTGWALQEKEILAAAEGKQRVIVTIRSAAAELYTLPWELLTVGQTMRHLGELPDVLVRYEWPGTTTRAEVPSPRLEGGRIFMAYSNAGGAVYPSKHLSAIEDACRAVQHPFDRERDVLSAASLGKLREALAAAKRENQPIAVLHLLCHGGRVGGAFGLMLDVDEEGESPGVDGATLGRVIGEHADMIRLVVLSACDSGNIGQLGNHMGSVAQAIHRAGVAAVIASRYPLSVGGADELVRVLYRELMVPPGSVEQAFLAARQHLTNVDTRYLDWAGAQLYSRMADGADSRPVVVRPYQGLLPLGPAQNRFFFGREKEVEEIVRDLGALVREGHPRLLVVQGWSGTGKSSMVMAGAVPLLTTRDAESEGEPGSPTWRPKMALAAMKPGKSPMTTLDHEIVDRVRSRPVLLVVDQLEEIFTHAEEAERTAFVREIWRLASDPDSGVSVLVTIRSDFIGRCGEILLDDKGTRLDAVANTEAHSIRVSQLSREQLRQTITRPAAKSGLVIAESLVNTILREIGSSLGALPLVAHTLHLLWIERSGRELTLDAYERIGRVTGALHQHADKLVDALDEQGRKLAERLFVSLVSRESEGDGAAAGARKRVTVKEIRDRIGHDDAGRLKSFDEMLQRLQDGRLLVLEGEGDRRTVEVAHEALIRGWKRLDDWLLRSGDMLRRQKEIDRWLAGYESHGTLLNERQIHAAEAFARDFPDDVSPAARRLLDESRKKIAAARLRGQALVAGSIAVAIGTGLLGFWAYRQKLAADARALEAKAAEEKAQDRASTAADALLISGAQGLLAKHDPISAMQLLGYVRRPDKQRDWLRLALQTLEISPQEAFKGHEGSVDAVAFSDDGRFLVTGSEDKTARVWDTRGAVKPFLMRHPGAVTSVAMGRGEGRWIATGCADGAARVWEVRRPGEPVSVLTTGKPVTRVEMTADNDVLVVSRGNARIWHWPRSSSEEPTTTPLGEEDSIAGASLDEDGAHAITAAKDGRVRVFSSAPVQEIAHFLAKDNLRHAEIAWSAGRAVTEAVSGRLEVWDIQARPPKVVPYHMPFQPSPGDPVSAWSLSRQGTLIAGYYGGRAFVMDRGSSPRLLDQDQQDRTITDWDAKAHKDDIVSVVENPRTADLVTASVDGIAKVWENGWRAQATVQVPGQIRATAISPDGLSVVLGSSERVAYLWRMKRRDMETLHGAAFVFDAKHPEVRLALPGDDGPPDFAPPGTKVQLAQLFNGTQDIPLRGVIQGSLREDGGLWSAVFNKDGSRVAGVTSAGVVRIWNVASPPRYDEGAPFFDEPFVLPVRCGGGSLPAPPPPVFTADGGRVLLVTNGKAEIHPTTAEGARTSFAGNDGEIVSAAVSPDDAWVAAGASTGDLYVWSTAVPGNPARRLRAAADLQDPILSIVFSKDGSRIVAVSAQGVARIWSTSGDASAGVCLQEQAGDEPCARGLYRVQVSADGRWIAGVTDNHKALVWSIDSPERPQAIGDANAYSVALDETGERVLVGEADAARLYVRASGALLAELGRHAGVALGVQFTPGGKEAITLSSLSAAQLWPIDTQNVKATLGRLIPSCLPKAKLEEYLEGTGLDPETYDRQCQRERKDRSVAAAPAASSKPAPSPSGTP